ncbi:MAG: GNAT family N-acetyltransferase [Burkholderiales bacterium]|nr:GNAT family N-acetyltransferase [Burkholderiales bacterium]
MSAPAAPAAAVRVRPIARDDEAAWRALWLGYCRFYEVALSDAVTDHTWQRICDPASPVRAIVADLPGDGVIGIANYILHENTWELSPVCYLEDLFVRPDCRAVGVGKALIDWLIAEMRAHGWSRVYWNTKENNYRARGLYDKYNPRDAFVRYVVKP